MKFTLEDIKKSTTCTFLKKASIHYLMIFLILVLGLSLMVLEVFMASKRGEYEDYMLIPLLVIFIPLYLSSLIWLYLAIKGFVLYKIVINNYYNYEYHQVKLDKYYMRKSNVSRNNVRFIVEFESGEEKIIASTMYMFSDLSKLILKKGAIDYKKYLHKTVDILFDKKRKKIVVIGIVDRINEI